MTMMILTRIIIMPPIAMGPRIDSQQTLERHHSKRNQRERPQITQNHRVDERCDGAKKGKTVE
jgi:hypothetical protein